MFEELKIMSGSYMVAGLMQHELGVLNDTIKNENLKDDETILSSLVEIVNNNSEILHSGILHKLKLIERLSGLTGYRLSLKYSAGQNETKENNDNFTGIFMKLATNLREFGKAGDVIGFLPSMYVDSFFALKRKLEELNINMQDHSDELDTTSKMFEGAKAGIVKRVAWSDLAVVSLWFDEYSVFREELEELLDNLTEEKQKEVYDIVYMSGKSEFFARYTSDFDARMSVGLTEDLYDDNAEIDLIFV